ncbi:MAG TPA: hypothetical protein VF008_13780 [Niastella sp.]
MKTVVLMGMSCLLLAGVYGVMNKKSEVSNLLSFAQPGNGTSPLSSENVDKTTTGLAADNNSPKTLDDSHWIDGPLFEKAGESDLVNDTETSETGNPHTKADQETNKQATPRQGIEGPVTEPVPEIKQLILEFNPDTTSNKKLLLEVI